MLPKLSITIWSLLLGFSNRGRWEGRSIRRSWKRSACKIFVEKHPVKDQVKT